MHTDDVVSINSLRTGVTEKPGVGPGVASVTTQHCAGQSSSEKPSQKGEVELENGVGPGVCGSEVEPV